MDTSGKHCIAWKEVLEMIALLLSSEILCQTGYYIVRDFYPPEKTKHETLLDFDKSYSYIVLFVDFHRYTHVCMYKGTT